MRAPATGILYAHNHEKMFAYCLGADVYQHKEVESNKMATWVAKPYRTQLLVNWKDNMIVGGQTVDPNLTITE